MYISLYSKFYCKEQIKAIAIQKILELAIAIIPYQLYRANKFKIKAQSSGDIDHDITEAAKKLPALIDAALRGEEIIISDGDHSLVRLIPTNPVKPLNVEFYELIKIAIAL